MKTASLTLDAKYTEASGRLVMTGTQALIRLLLTQKRRDAAAGHNTAGYLAGYRGSPLGMVDLQAIAAKRLLEAEDIVFRPGVNEDLALTSVWGTQMTPLFPGAKHEGVFAMWYGKGPGVDRSGDALKHANYAGTTRLGGVLAVAGDDHAAKSSTIANQSEQALIAAGVPVMAPASVADILELGLYGWAASRHSGLYIGFKTVEEIIDATAAVDTAPGALAITMPEIDPELVGMRLHEAILAQEARVLRYRYPALLDFVRANPVNRLIHAAPGARLGIVTAGKSTLDVAQALDDLELGDIRLLKLGMTWPVEPQTIRDFATGLEEILVVEEKQPFIENQLRTILYDQANRPRITGKTDGQGKVLLKAEADLSAAEVLLAIGDRAQVFVHSDALAGRLANLRDRISATRNVEAVRTPHFCSGCPHNTSTRVPEGSRAMAGIGCHYMATWMDRQTDVYSHMGGEGAAWIGQAPFTEENHVFVNLGDGTYHHSGLLAIRAAVAAGVNITYKILFNDAVAMTGGQQIDGPLSVPQITRQLAAEGVARIEIVTDEPEKYRTVRDLAPGVTVHHRSALDAVQREMRQVQGVSALVYDQTCATEKRRRRKRGTMADPAKRAFINQRVCEGCGDCSQTSNCVSVVPVETEFGRKRAIDQSSCNKDFSCVEGFCPSFVTVQGGSLRKPEALRTEVADPPEPVRPAEAPWNILVAGIGGTGIVTIGALLGMAAHLEGRRVSVLDVLGLAQKGGAVVSHIRIGGAAGVALSHRVPVGEADLLLGCDALVAGGHETLETLRAGRSAAVLNLHETITGEFTRNPDVSLPMRQLRRAIEREAGEAAVQAFDATRMATALLGDAIATNLFLLGYAWQLGKVPVGREAITEAITLNGQAVAMNIKAFAWGRAAAHDPAAVEAMLGMTPAKPVEDTTDPDALVARFRDELVAYQDARYAGRYMALVAAVREAETRLRPGSAALTEAVARNFYKLMAYKDEYEVARLYRQPAFRKGLEARFDGDYRLHFHLAPPLLAKRDPRTGHLRKQEFGPWVERAFSTLARFKRLRGTRLDVFGHTGERKAERALIGRYEASIHAALPHLSGGFTEALALAQLPAQIRGFGHVKEENLRRIEPEWQRLDSALAAGLPHRRALAAE